MNAVDVEGLGLFHLPVQLSSTHIGPVLQIRLEALTGNINPLDGQIGVLFVKGDPDVGISDQAGDRAFTAGLRDHAMGAFNEPHLRVWGQKHPIILTALHSSLNNGINDTMWTPSQPSKSATMCAHR